MLIAILLAGLAGWQGWHCAGSAMATPLAVGHLAHGRSPGHGLTGDGQADDQNSPGQDSMLLGVCLSVLAAIAGSLILLESPRRVAGLLRAMAVAKTVLTAPLDISPPALTQLCVSRT